MKTSNSPLFARASLHSLDLYTGIILNIRGVENGINHRNAFISKNSWLIFRDYAILPGMGYTLKVKLTEAKSEGKTVPIFPKRDVIEG